MWDETPNEKADGRCMQLTKQTTIDPRQWPNSKRRQVAICVGLFAFLEPFASSMIAPALSLIAEEFHISSSVERNLVLSAFVLPYAPGTLLLAPISESVGRRPVMLLSAAVFLAFTLGCGFAQNSAQLIVCRVFSGLGGCVPLAIGAATIGDMYSPDERGSAMALYFGLQLAGPATGPIMGGWIAQTIDSWRWTNYVCAIATSVVLAIGVIALPETYAPKLNREQVPGWSAITRNCMYSLRRPIMLLATQPIIQVLALYAAVVFGTFYLFLTTISSTFISVYDQSVGVSSLHYIALLLGFGIGVLVTGKPIDRVYRRLKDRYGGGEEFVEARIPFLAASATVLPAGLLLYGWSAQKHVFWFVPDMGLFLAGMGIMAPLAAVQHYILDCYSKTGFAASALAGMNVARFLAAFGFPLFADVMFASLGLGWGVSLLALAAVIAGCLSTCLWTLGPWLRSKSALLDT